jgi:argininosuccinate lyase
MKIVFIESNTTGTGKIFAEKAIKKGYEVIFLASDPARYHFLSELMILAVKIDTSDKEEVLSYLQKLDSIEGVFSSSEYFIETTAFIAKQLGLPCNNSLAINACRDKAELCNKLLANNIKTPQSQLITTLAEANTLLEKLHFPVVIKPASGSGSIGVKLCEDKEAYLYHIQQLLSENTNERGNKIEPRILVQEYILGDEYSVEVLASGQQYDIIGITQKYLGKPPYFVETGHDFPAQLAQETEQKIHATVKSALSVMGFTFGAAHIELRIFNNEAYIIEINPRLAGGMIPALIHESLGIDILELVLDLHCGKSIEYKQTQKRYTSIRFVIPNTTGTIQQIKFNQSPATIQGLKIHALTKSAGDITTQYGDYRDRIGYVIASGNDITESRRNADNALQSISLIINANSNNQHSGQTGRVNKPLHPVALSIINHSASPESLAKELGYLTSIDESHLLMLLHQKIIPKQTILTILKEIKSLKDSNFETIKHQVSLRGSYLLYENALIEKLGMDVGGVVHTGRSRNDINATLFKLTTRELYKNSYQALWKLRQTILHIAQNSQNIHMPVYSQFQTALPGSYAYYLIAIEEALARDQAAFKTLYDQLAQSPLGAAAGCGTSFPINPTLTAKYLGFDTINPIALDAIASRDLALRLLSCLSMTGTTLSRIAQDYQLWTTQEFAFFELPDDLSGSSSMMPQKKNPYLLEKIKGKSILPTGQLMSTLAIMQKTPFSNSVEVGTEALEGFDRSFKAIIESSTLLNLMIANMQAIEENMHKSSINGLTTAVCVTESLVKSGIPFREAHHRVGQAISDAIKLKHHPLDAIYQLIPDHTKREDLSYWTNTFAFGGGCSQDSVKDQIISANHRLKSDGIWLQKIDTHWNKSNELRHRTIEDLLNETTK